MQSMIQEERIKALNDKSPRDGVVRVLLDAGCAAGRVQSRFGIFDPDKYVKKIQALEGA